MLWVIGFMSDASCKLLRLLYLKRMWQRGWFTIYMNEKSSGKGSRSSGKSFLDFSYLMWNNGLIRCGLISVVTSFCGEETFGCVGIEFLPKINVGRLGACCFFDGIVFNDGGIGFSISSCFIHCDELRKFVSVLLKLFDERVEPMPTILLLTSRTSFSGWKLLWWCCGSLGSVYGVAVSDMNSKLFKFLGSAAKPRT